jgi:hypothetical protein
MNHSIMITRYIIQEIAQSHPKPFPPTIKLDLFQCILQPEIKVLPIDSQFNTTSSQSSHQLFSIPSTKHLHIHL